MIIKRSEIDPYTYQVDGYFVTEIPTGKGKDRSYGYSCQCSMLTAARGSLFPCIHIKKLLEWKKS